MTRVRIASLLAALCLTTAALASQQKPQPPQPTFRAGTKLLLLDVAVLDAARRPVRGLRQPDFTVLIDGRPRPVATFKAVEPPPFVNAPATPIAAWTRDTAPDVRTNRNPPGRLVTILIDDYSIGEARLGPAEIAEARRTAMSVVDALGPTDRGAVLFSNNSHTAQTFTTDRRLLRAAIDGATLVSGPQENVAGMTSGDQGFCDCGVCSMRALEHVARSLRSLPDQRKTVFYISAGSVVTVPRSLISPNQPEVPDGALRKEHCAWERVRAMDVAIRQAQISNVTIESFDPTGLALGGKRIDDIAEPLSGGGSGEANPQFKALEAAEKMRTEYLRAMAESTGGRAVVNNNDMHNLVPAVLAESASYYLLGVEPPAAVAGRFHRVQVRVNGRVYDVRTRSGYYDPTEDDLAAAAAVAIAGADSAILSPLPANGFPLEVVAAPFATGDGPPILALALGVWPSAGETRPFPRTEIVDVVASLFNPESGDNRGEHKARLSLTWARADARFGSYEVLSTLPAKPGRYELRVGVKTDDGREGSVYTSVEVPDFDDEELSLSGLMLNAVPAPMAAAAEAMSSLVPAPPTARRAFRPSDRAMAFLRVFQKGDKPLSATVNAAVTNVRDEIVANDTQQLDGTPAGRRSNADYQIGLPLASLGPGEYLLTVRVVAGDHTRQRQLRFRVET